VPDQAEQLDRLKAALADRYRLEPELGAGGMATVYLAEDLKHKRKVALKVLKPELAAVFGAERFVQEITTTASLQHPHILPLFDSGEADGFLYYVMPFIGGETLRDKLDRETQLGIEEAVKIVIHRDIKPENILLHDGRPMVADFGIALAVSAAAGGRMTETGLSLGTPNYMSPEQATAEKDLSNRSDIYSLGAVLYEMLTGSPPHVGSSAQQIIMKIVTEEAAPVTKVRKAVPPNVAAATAKALEKLPADRFGSAQAFAEALGDVTFSTAARLGHGDSVTGRGPPWKLVSAVVGSAIVAGSAGWILRPIPEIPEIPRRPVQFSIESDSAHRISPGSAALSPDGSVLVYNARSGSGSMLYRRRIDELDAHPIAGTEGGFAPFFSPDGTQLGLEAEGALRRVRLDGGAPRTITEFDGNLLGVDWGDDDEIVFSTWRPWHVYTVSGNAGTPEFLEVLDRLADTLEIASPVFIPGARALLFAAGGWPKRVGVVSLESPDVRWLMPGGAPQYVRSGHLVYVEPDGSLVAQPFDVAKLDTAGPARRVAEGVGIDLGLPMLAVSSSGTLVYSPASSEGRDLVLVARDGNEQLVLQDRGFWVPRFSPDGSRNAFGVVTGGQEDIWIHDLARGTTSRLTFDGQRNNDPVWNPDGTSVAFSRDFAAKDLYVLSAEGGDPAPVVAQDGHQWTTDWSPDGRHVVFTNVTANADIWVAPLTGEGEPRAFFATRYEEGGGRISPNGRWLAYHSDESGQLEVYVQTFPAPGNKRLISTGGGQDPIWGPNGQELFYWNPQGQLIATQLTAGDDIAVGRRDVLFRFPGYLFFGNAQYDVHPDGQRFVIVRNEMQSRLIVALDLIDPQP
jgi:serine/threonine-protein kinase